MKRNRIKVKKGKENHILETKADKIIFSISVGLYALIMLIEFKLTPMHTTVSSSIAAFGISAFLISKAIHIKKVRPPIFPKDKIKLWAMLLISIILTLSAIYWLLSNYIL